MQILSKLDTVSNFSSKQFLKKQIRRPFSVPQQNYFEMNILQWTSAFKMVVEESMIKLKTISI
jgi:hypothetical protein